MRTLKKVRRKSRTSRRFAGAVVFLSVLYVFFFVTEGLASQEAIYKGPGGKQSPLTRDRIKGSLSNPEKQSTKGYTYDSTGKTDPFKSFIAEQEAVEEKKQKEPKTYLETLDVSQLDLIAIILSPKGNWAMVRDAKGLGYPIKKGTPIGINDGVVHQIKEKEIIIREKVKDFRSGQVRHRDITKKLYQLQ